MVRLFSRTLVGRRRATGFTLIEMMVVMAIVATLLTLALPRYFHSVERSREAVLKQDLRIMRDAIDKYFSDRGRYPPTLQELAEKRYLRQVPPDPVTDSASTWITLPPPEGELRDGVYDVRSGAPGHSLDGEPYESW
ncbi:MAG: prepilin-type N-terminal cleavage/methylation domain-containing protein [Burkholderiaceae bacterium]|nr:prepilin-type N-terminal cleavage/methylation domain-containing protein [Burkholderiaceae bacterium]